jgi:hypothetical protein
MAKTAAKPKAKAPMAGKVPAKAGKEMRKELTKEHEEMMVQDAGLKSMGYKNGGMVKAKGYKDGGMVKAKGKGRKC